jgi:hypothetical protein
MNIRFPYFGTAFARCKAIQRVPIFGSCTFAELGNPLLATHPILPTLIFTSLGIAGCLEARLKLTLRIGQKLLVLRPSLSVI